MKRYGGITLATYAPETNSDMILAPRNSRYEVVQQILDDLDEAISRLKIPPSLLQEIMDR